MVLPLVRRLLRDGVLTEAHWVSLNSTAPKTVEMPGITLHNVRLDPTRMREYGKVKEAIWNRVHRTDGDAPPADLFWTDAFSEFAYYNRVSAELMRRLDRTQDFDAFYIHDFQQLPVGQMLGTLKPKLFRWHIPFPPGAIPSAWRALLQAYFRSYDVVVVSTQRIASSLRAFGHQGAIVRLPPYVDPEEYAKPGPEDVEQIAHALGIPADAFVILVVGRMDPTKGQDRAIDAFAAVAGRHPRAHLVLVGNGSFSGSKAGLGLPKSAAWRSYLEDRVRDLGLRGRVTFTGHVDQRQLDALYERCAFTILPSVEEGFGLVVVESWIHGRPVIVSRTAGISELVRDGENGLLFDGEIAGSLVRQVRRLLGPRGAALGRSLVDGGRSMAGECSLEAAAVAEQALLSRTLEAA